MATRLPSFRTKVAGVTLDRAALEAILTSEPVRAAVRGYAEIVGDEALRLLGTPNDLPGTVEILDDNITPGDSDALSRRRVAVLLKHPTPKGRSAAVYALLAVMQ